MAFSFDLGLAISAERYGAISAGPEQWQKKIFAMAKAQQELQFAEVTPVIPSNGNGQIALSIHVGGIAADIHNGADPATVEAVLRILKLC